MKRCFLVLVLVLALAACSRINEENFRKVEEGMSEDQVVAILGKPTESNSMSVLGVGGTVSRWTSGDAAITVRFVNGKVALKSYDKPAQK